MKIGIWNEIQLLDPWNNFYNFTELDLEKFVWIKFESFWVEFVNLRQILINDET